MAEVATSEQTHPPRPAGRAWTTAALMLVMALAALESTITSTAMYTVVSDLHGLEHYSWVASIYLLASTISMPLYGRLADTLGRKRVLLFAIGLFSLGSIAAAFSQSMLQLILFRALQGLGAGGIMPVVLTILGDIFTLQERARIQTLFSAIWGGAALAGPALGAALVQALGWRSIFWASLPPGAIGLAILLWQYHDREQPHSRALDLPGIALLSIGSTALLIAISICTLPHVPYAAPLALLAVAVVCLWLLLKVERRTASPALDPALIRSRAIGPAVLGSGLLGIGVFAIDTYVPLYVQGGRGGSVEAAAMAVTPVMLAWSLSMIVAAPLVVRWGFRRVGILGSVITLTGMLGVVACSLLTWPLWLLTVLLFICGAGFGPASAAYLLGAQDAVAWQQRGSVTAAVTFFRNFGAAVGVAALGSVFNLVTRHDLAVLRAKGISPAQLLDREVLKRMSPTDFAPVHDAIIRGMVWVFVGMVLGGLAQVIVSTWMAPRRCDHRPKAGEMIETMTG